MDHPSDGKGGGAEGGEGRKERGRGEEGGMREEGRGEGRGGNGDENGMGMGNIQINFITAICDNPFMILLNYINISTTTNNNSNNITM